MLRLGTRFHHFSSSLDVFRAGMKLKSSYQKHPGICTIAIFYMLFLSAFFYHFQAFRASFSSILSRSCAKAEIKMVRSTFPPCCDVTGGQSCASGASKKCGGVKVLFPRLLRIQEVPSKRGRYEWETILEELPVQFWCQLELMRPEPSHFTIKILR